MQRILRKKVYDTQTAKELLHASYGAYGDPAGYEEYLYQAPEGHFFLYGIGGPESPYPNEKITCFSKEKAEAWAKAHF